MGLMSARRRQKAERKKKAAETETEEQKKQEAPTSVKRTLQSQTFMPKKGK